MPVESGEQSREYGVERREKREERRAESREYRVGWCIEIAVEKENELWRV